MSNDISAGAARPAEQDRIVLVDQQGVTCWLERVPPDCCGSLIQDSHRSITVVISGGPVEMIDGRDRVLSRTTLTPGQVIRGREPQKPHRLCNLADRALVLVIIELPEPTPTS
ncbi:hypothetical protein [Nocardia sp. NPDC051570]|uniref:hypothetical protein n=1 Tax=Nocardia sp. NPDC051570 TaxID=3364324 RepID=UPI003794F5A1